MVRSSLPLRGLHNVRNATGALAMAVTIGVPFETAVAALAKFGGVARRFDMRGIDDGVTFVDDYAHLPAEIAAVLAAARGSGDGWRRVIAVFQPNRFNRMATMSPDYRDSFVDADVIVLTEIYPSGTAPIPGVTGKLVVNAVLDAHPGSTMVWMPRRDDLVDYLARTSARRRRLRFDGLRRHQRASRGSASSDAQTCGSDQTRHTVSMNTASLDQQQHEALARLGSFATANESLAPYTTYRVGGTALVFASPRNDDELAPTGGSGARHRIADAGRRAWLEPARRRRRLPGHRDLTGDDGRVGALRRCRCLRRCVRWPCPCWHAAAWPLVSSVSSGQLVCPARSVARYA